MTATTAAAEWRRSPLLPIAAALGYACSVIHIYGLGPYIAPIAGEFGWSRTFVTSGLTVATLVQALLAVPIGILVDRIGPRWLGVAGVLLTCAGFAALGSASGGTANWFALWLLLAVAVLPVQATIWTAAVASRFTASRGLAFALTLCGASVAGAVFPPLATWLIGAYGLRTAFVAHGAIWAAVAFPVVLLFFRGARDDPGHDPAAVAPAEGASFAEGLRSTVYLRLLLASTLFTFTILGLVVHFVPILTDRGADPLAAAGIAALIGLASIVGRLGTGLLLDRFSGARVGAGVFVLPALGCALLLAAGSAVPLQAVAALCIGLTLGAEVDVIVYLTTRYFGLRAFGALYGGLLVALSVGTASGPLVAARVFDVTGGYGPFLAGTIALSLLSALALGSLPRHPPPLP